MKFHANHVSASIDGDYYQVLFEAKKDTSEFESPYLLIQRQFEDPDGGVCYVETLARTLDGAMRSESV